MERYGIYLERDGVVIALPVLPQELTTQQEHDNFTGNTLGVGEVMVPRIPRLRVVQLSSYFPAQQGPEGYRTFLAKAMEEGAVLMYTKTPAVGGELPYRVMVTRFDTWEKGGEPGDLYYHLELTEHRPYGGSALTGGGVPSTVSTGGSPPRETPPAQLVVGSRCIANGRYWATSYGEPPFGTANGRLVVVSRMVDPARPAPIHINTPEGGPLGWIGAAALEVQG